jgi:hypothetical protein
MYREGDHFHYTKSEIKSHFRQHLKNWRINKDEYSQLCKVISCLDSDQVKMLQEEIVSIIFGEQKDKSWDDKIIPACYRNLRGEIAEKGIIFLAPDFSNLHFTLKKLFHELAHHVLDHRNEDDPDTVAKNETKADELALKWYAREYWHLEDC